MLIPSGWIETEATVTTCRFQTPGLSLLAFGFSTRQRFRITFDYYAHGRLYSNEFQSAVAVPQNERIRIAYNPLNPAENTRGAVPPTTPSGDAGKPPLFLIGILGSVVLSLAWLLVLRGCH